MKCDVFPLVTVITVCFNQVKQQRAQAFRKCLKSVHSQDYPVLEHLVIDGGSADGTADMLARYAALGWIRYISEPDKGIYDAMNKGIRQARGKYVAFLNSDDFWHRRDAVSASVAALEKSNAAFSYASRTIVHENGAFYCTESACLGVFPGLMPFCHQTMFTRRDVLLRYGGFDFPRYRSAADYDLIFRLLLKGERGVYVPINFTTFRLGGFSVENEDLSLLECHQIRTRLLGKRAARMLEQGKMDENLMLRLQETVHPRVALDIQRSYALHDGDLYCMRQGLVRQFARQEKIVVFPPCIKRSVRYYIFQCVPILSCKLRPSRKDWFLFQFLPLLRERIRGNVVKYYLFFLLPVLSRRVQA